MRVAILGAGAMGCRFAHALAGVPDLTVKLLSRSPDPDWVQVEGQERRVVERGAANEPADLLLVLVKAYATRAALAWASAAVGPQTLLLTLQNGLGNAEALAEAAEPGRVLVGTTTSGATLLGPGLVRSGGDGLTRIAPWEAEGPAAKRIGQVASLLERAGFQTEVSDQPGHLLWEKLVINAGINGLTAILRIPNGGLLERPAAQRLMERTALEAYHVALAEGVFLADTTVEQVRRTAAATAANRSSMLQDLEQGRRTEAEAINGEVLRRGREAGVATPTNELILELIRALEPET